MVSLDPIAYWRQAGAEHLRTAPAERSAIGEKPRHEVEYRIRALGQQSRAPSRGDCPEPLGGIGAPGEDDGLDAGSDCALRRAGIAAAIENRHKTRGRYGPARRLDPRLPPARPGIEPGSRRTQQRDRTARFGRRL